MQTLSPFSLLDLSLRLPDQSLLNAFELLSPGGILYVLDRQETPDVPTAAERLLALIPQIVQRPDLPYLDTPRDRLHRQSGRMSINLAFQKLPATAS